MFDPTAFDNLKTVLEGTVYDRDLDGTVKITNRSDKVDIATLCRSFTVTFHVQEKSFEADMNLYADLKKLSAELLPDRKGQEAGASISIIFRKYASEWTDDELTILSEQWGENRCYDIRKVSSTRNEDFCEAVVRFERTITEDMLRDIEDMVYFVIETLDFLEGRQP
ncbi:hypothetical protein JMA_19260 [Jeotgalibacillus malaysiensis]|uniref:Uncharacterized protein n=1 Tax=Jeotgalibacillus malaysiensis TaxID=1508404 RepID=A0A0B5ARQ6_9BACL|nr:hypothetical protein [Jeotgalibacillus malaysiensis]AJD91243.1 hypothetical protein JMA_19260 [Jeotgalibacillus malaysiensis]